MQLSIFNLSPTAIFFFARFLSRLLTKLLQVLLVGSNGLEPSTELFKKFLRNFKRLRSVRVCEPSNKPPNISAIYSLLCWWAQMDSNHRPHAYQACALTN